MGTELEVQWFPTGKRVFPKAMLDMPNIAFLGRQSNDHFDTGFIANRSQECVGLSNIIAAGLSAMEFHEAAHLAARFGEGLPIVRYNNGAELDLTLKIGFQSIGNLRT
ncbi:MAG: hypothetical protein AB8B94_06530 [Hyphomicrobiales bacterium]